MISPDPSAALSNRRPCPYCGAWNDADFTFCQRCGKGLPSLGDAERRDGTTASPPAITAGLAASTTPTLEPETSPVDDSPVQDRALTTEEIASLKRAQTKGPVAVLRFMGAFVGIIPLFLIAMVASGAPMIAENYTVIMFGSGFIAVLLAGSSQSLRQPIARALASQRAREVWGVPEAGGQGADVVSLGGIAFRLTPARATRLLPNGLNHIVYVEGGPGAGPRRKPGWLAAYILERNGERPVLPVPCYVAEGDGAIPSAASTSGG